MDGRVELGDRVVVVLAGKGDLVFGLSQLSLKIEEVLVGLQIWVCLCDCVDLHKRLV